MKILLVYGARVDTTGALRRMGKPLDYVSVPSIFLRSHEGLSERVLRANKPIVLVAPGPTDRSGWVWLEKALNQAREAEKELVIIEAPWSEALRKCVGHADIIYIEGHFFERKEGWQ